MMAMASQTLGASIGYLLLDTFPSALALPAANVLDIVRANEWHAEPAIPLSSLVPIYFADSEPERVVRIGAGANSLAALISGKVRVEYLRAGALLAMPDLSGRGFENFSEVVLADGRPSALVVNIDALLRLHRELGK